ncbi:MAG: 2-oxo acid dehydrogenase subunit E2, partial [Solirubrobacterales bacterium]
MSDGLIELQMPQMGESVTEGTILEWHVAEGEEVSEGDTVVEVSTDKIDAEVPAPASGVIAKILAQPDDTVEVGQVLAQIDTDAAGNGADPSPLKDAEGELVTGGGEGDEDLGDDSVESASAQPGQIETPVAEAEADDRPSADPGAPGGEAEAGGTLVVAMPEMGESVTEGTVLEWHVSEGQTVDEGDTVIEVSTDKVDAEVPAPASGTITKLLVDVDDTVQVGQALAEMAAGAGNGASAAAPAPAETETETETPPGAPAEVDQGNGKASPVARRIAAAKGIDLGAVSGSGPGGKVVKEDVLAAADGGNGAGPAVGVAAGEVKPLRGPAAMLAKAMDESRSVPTATSFRTLAVDTLDAKRKAINGALKDRGMKVSFTHLIAWAIVRAATEWPVMGRSYSEVDGKPQVVEAPAVNLGIAVDVERKGGRSLLVPCIQAAESGDFAAFHSRYEELITRTRENKLTADDFQGTTISLTNPGGIGTVASVPRLMKGQGTIVATGSIAYPAEWAHATADRIKALGVSKVMTMTSTYDHRVIQGAESGSFLRRLDSLLQGEDDFYESVAEAFGIPTNLVTNAHAASASAPPLGAVQAPATTAPAVAGEPDREILQAVQAATSLLKAYRTHGHLAANVNPLGGVPKGDPALEPENVNL